MLIHDVDRAQRVGHHHHRQHSQGQGDFVANRLGCSPQAAQQRIFVVARVAAHQQADRLNAAEGHPEENSHPNIADQQVLAEGHDQPGQDHWHDHQHRSQGEQQAIGPCRDDVLFDQQLQAIGQGLQDAQGTGVFRADALLHSSGNLALQPHRHQHADHGGHQHQQHRQGQPDQPAQPRADATSFQQAPEAGF